MTTDPPQDAVVRPFADFLREQTRGRSHEELSRGLVDLVTAVRATGKAGTLTYTLKVAPLKGQRSALDVADEVKVKLPALERPSSLFFADANGNLRRDDPDQLAFEGLREVPDARADGEPLREVR